MIFLLQAGFFNPAQQATLASAIVTIVSAVAVVAPVYGTFLLVRLHKMMQEIRETQKSNEVKIDAISQRPRHRSSDDA